MEAIVDDGLPSQQRFTIEPLSAASKLTSLNAESSRYNGGHQCSDDAMLDTSYEEPADASSSPDWREDSEMKECDEDSDSNCFESKEEQQSSLTKLEASVLRELPPESILKGL